MINWENLRKSLTLFLFHFLNHFYKDNNSSYQLSHKRWKIKSAYELDMENTGIILYNKSLSAKCLVEQLAIQPIKA